MRRKRLCLPLCSDHYQFLTGRGHFKVGVSPPGWKCELGDGSVEYVLFECVIHEDERNRLRRSGRVLAICPTSVFLDTGSNKQSSTRVYIIRLVAIISDGVCNCPPKLEPDGTFSLFIFRSPSPCDGGPLGRFELKLIV